MEWGTADQWERGMATQQPITRICSPAVVELVRTNLAPDFPLFHADISDRTADFVRIFTRKSLIFRT